MRHTHNKTGFILSSAYVKTCVDSMDSAHFRNENPVHEVLHGLQSIVR